MININRFLPFKQAFKTTILSKRWRPLPRSLAVLNINDYDVNNTDDCFLFCQFMDTDIFSPNSHHLPLTSFDLFMSRSQRFLPDYFTYDRWIEAAKQRRVKRLSLFYFSKVPLAPTTIFCCKTLVDLCLINVTVAKMTCCSVDLPSLQILNMELVCFHDMENFMRLIYGCPLLACLKISQVEAGDGVTGNLKPLSKLIQADIGLLEFPLRIFCNVQFLTINDYEVYYMI
jgi:hypothetical protein